MPHNWTPFYGYLDSRSVWAGSVLDLGRTYNCSHLYSQWDEGHMKIVGSTKDLNLWNWRICISSAVLYVKYVCNYKKKEADNRNVG